MGTIWLYRLPAHARFSHENDDIDHQVAPLCVQTLFNLKRGVNRIFWRKCRLGGRFGNFITNSAKSKYFYFFVEPSSAGILLFRKRYKGIHAMTYTRFFSMIVASTLIMYGLMYLNTFQLDHIFFSQTRAWMAIYMGAVMAAVMLAFMWGMYKGEGAKIGILAGSAVVFAASLYLVRSQDTVDDVSWMKAMIPHHSIAILTSGRANISDPRVRQLADDIIAAQLKEIDEMKALIVDLEGQ